MTGFPSTPTSEEDLRQSEERFRLLVESVRDYAIFMLDPQGHVLSWNAGAKRIKGYDASEIIGEHFSRFYPAETLARGLPAHELDVASATGSFEDEGWRVRKDGSQFWANVVITAIRGRSGRLLGFAKVTRDLTQRRSHEEDMRRGEERFRLLVEGIPDYAIFMLDVNGRVATWNLGAQRIKGYSADAIIGQHFSVFYPPDAVESGWPEHELQRAAETGCFVDEGWRVRQDGTTFWADVTIRALRDEAGKLIGFAKLTRDLTERRRSEAAELASRQREELLDAERSARMAAQRATRVKDEFLAMLSHELRTPLSAILGWTQVLQRTATTMPAADLQRAVEIIDRNARAQVRLIDDLLDLSRVMTGKIRLDLRPVSMHDVVQAAIESALPAATAKDVRLHGTLDPAPSFVVADAARVQQVVWNLLTNAIKFTPGGGEVEVRLERTGTHVQLRVRDTGIGIPATFIGQVFDRFSQRESSTTRSHGGLGLGLAISRQLVELHGGSIGVTSPGEDLGATFVVELPLSAGRHDDGSGTVAGSGAQDPVALPRLGGVHVLVVEDEPDVRDLVQRVLEDQGANVTSFCAGADALEALARLRPAVIVSDIGMPGMDGYQFMRTWRAGEARGERIPALALTAFARAEDRKKSLLAGYQAHLAKPFDLTELVLVVADLAGR